MYLFDEENRNIQEPHLLDLIPGLSQQVSGKYQDDPGLVTGYC